MKRILTVLAASFLIVSLGGVQKAPAQWGGDGVVVCAAQDDQYEVEIASDGSDGVILVWKDLRSDAGDIFAQRIDGGGRPLWGPDGKAVCTAAGDQHVPQLMAFGDGGAIFGWSDSRLGDPTAEVYVQRLTGDGSPQWMPNGRWVNYGASLACIVDDGAGGAFLVWSEAATYPVSVAVQPITAAGYLLWADYATAGQGYNISAVPDGSGGLVLGWQRWWSATYRNTIQGQHMDASGGLGWPADMVSPTYGYDLETPIASDGAGGGVWAYQHGPSAVAQRVGPAGALLWGADGINPLPNVTLSDSDQPVYAVGDGAGGAFVIALTDQGHLYMNRVLANGSLAWGADGVLICDAPASRIWPRLAADGLGGVYAVWHDWRDFDTNETDLYVEHVDGSGSLLWGGDGLRIGSAAGSQGDARITGTPQHGAFVAWSERPGPGEDLDVYVQALHLDGTVGDPPIRLAAVTPTANATGVAADADVVVSFSSAASPATDWANSVIVYGSRSGLHAGSYSYDAASRTLTFDPAYAFASGEVVQVMLTDGIGTVTGYALEPQVWSFTAGAAATDGAFAAPSAAHATGNYPIAICAADLDGDRFMDLASVNTEGSITVLKGTGDGSFLPQATFAAAVSASDIIAADLDRDGDMDLVTVHGDTYDAFADVSVHLNAGNGTFSAPANYSVGQNPAHVCAADFDGDGYLDLAVSTSSSGPASAYVLLNQGDGTFGSASPRFAGYYLTAVVAGDFNGDGRQDLVFGSTSGSDRISVLLGQGDGYFEAKIDTDPGSAVSWLDCADFDGDGDLDLVASGRVGLNSGYAAVLFNGGNADFGPPTAFVTRGRAITCDVNGDGYSDLLYLAATGIAVRLNDGAGAFLDEIVYDADPSQVDLCAADFNGDGAVDIAVSNSNYYEPSITVLLNRTYISGVGTGDVPSSTRLVHNVPNPFNPLTRIVYSLHEPGHVRLVVYDTRGREVAVLVDERQPAREHVVAWDGRDHSGRRVSSGTYFCRFDAGDRVQTMKMTLVK